MNMDHLAAELSEPQDRSVIAGEDEVGDWLDAVAEENLRNMVDRITIYPGNVLDVLLCLNDECKQWMTNLREVGKRNSAQVSS